MTYHSYDFQLVKREDLRREREEARKRILQAAFLGENIDSADIARLRGLRVHENEDSILSDAWIFLAVVIILVGLIAGRNPSLLALGLVLLIILVVGTVWKNLALVGVLYQRSFDHTHVFPDEPVKMTVTAYNNKGLPLTWLRFQDTLPVSPDTINVISRPLGDTSDIYLLVNSYSMHGHQEVERTTTLRFPNRGYYKLGPVTYQSGDVFTLFRTERVYNYISTIVVYPRVYPLEMLGLPAKEPFGDLRIKRSLFSDPIKIRSIRDYQPHDRFRDIHWKATARRSELQTKVYDPSTGMTIAVFLNVATMARHWMGFYPETMERAVSVAASVAQYGSEQRWGVGLYANGAFPDSDQPIRVPPGRSAEQLTHILEALAAITEFATSSIEVMLLRESPKLPWAATIVLVTAVVTEETMVALLRLKEAGRRVVLISLADEPAPETGVPIQTYHIPPAAFPSSPFPVADNSHDHQQ